MVTDSREEDGPKRPQLTPGKQFEKVCGWYLSIGMSYTDFWDGDPVIAKYYRDKYQCDRERKNTEMWLQGAYIYEAILETIPAMNFFAKRPSPLPYRNEPFPLDEQNREGQEQRKQEKNKNAGKEFVEAWAIRANANRKKKEQSNGS